MITLIMCFAHRFLASLVRLSFSLPFVSLSSYLFIPSCRSSLPNAGNAQQNK